MTPIVAGWLAWAEITERQHVYQGPHGFVGPCEMIVVAGTAP